VEGLGYRFRFSEHAFGRHGHVSAPPAARAEDLHALFADPEVHAILATIGGYCCNQLLPYLDFSLIKANPKILLGFSDITVLQVALWSRVRLVTFSGPTLLTDFAELPDMPAYSIAALTAVVQGPVPAGPLAPPTWWTDEFLEWGSPDGRTRGRSRREPAGWAWLKPGRGRGFLLGGCLESLQHLRGTAFWPSWAGAIMVLECSTRGIPPGQLDAFLTDLRNLGVLAGLRGLIFGRFLGCAEDHRRRLHEIILQATSGYDFPVVAEVDVGHTSPRLTLPIGVEARLDGFARELEITGAAVQ
jgi:muramoyltetrapeptide carboxypeptidase